MLNTFAGGPFDQRVISTADLLQLSGIQDYRWTAELIPTRTGERARVWQYKHDLSEEVSQQVSAPPPPPSQEESMSEDVQFTALEAQRRKAGISRQQLANRIGGELGTVSKVYRIERAGDDSKRTNEPERAAYSKALEELTVEKVEADKRKAEEKAAKAAEKAKADEAKAAEAAAAESTETAAAPAAEDAAQAAAEDPNAPAF